jgi:hypothetical protein
LDNPQEAHMDAQAEKALLLAILIQSVRDMRGIIPGVSGVYAAKIQREAMRWLVSDRRTIGSFCWVCSDLNLSPSWLRRELLALVGSGGKVSSTRARRMGQRGRSQHDGALGIYYPQLRYGGR